MICPIALSNLPSPRAIWYHEISVTLRITLYLKAKSSLRIGGNLNLRPCGTQDSNLTIKKPKKMPLWKGGWCSTIIIGKVNWLREMQWYRGHFTVNCVEQDGKYFLLLIATVDLLTWCRYSKYWDSHWPFTVMSWNKKRQNHRSETTWKYYLGRKKRPMRLIISQGISKIFVNTSRRTLLLTLPNLKSEWNLFPHEGQAISIPPMFSGNRNCWPHFGHSSSV